MKLSFVIPVYNGSRYLVSCLDSIINIGLPQDDFEIIVVDDCSTDNTCQLVADYAKNYTNTQLRLLSQNENKRQGAARNLGLKKAKGKYISFVDGDDIVLDGVVPALDWAEQLQVDMVYCSCYHEKSATKSILKEIDMPENSVMSGRDFCERYQQEGVFWYPWGFLIRKDWLADLNYPFIEGRQHEDRDWMAYVLSHAQSVCNSKTPMYRYVCNTSSTCRTLRYSTVFDHIASGIRHIDLSKQLANDCPKLSSTLYDFGVDEIYKSIRLRHLTKFTWADNKHFYDEKHLRPLLQDLQRICRENKMPMVVLIAAFCPRLTKFITFFVSPISKMIRKLKH